MTDSLWDLPAYELMSRTATPDPTPGGGSVSAVAGALGIALVEMAVAITDDRTLDVRQARLRSLREQVATAADQDIADFTEVMAAYRMPRADPAQREARAREMERTAITATSIRSNWSPYSPRHADWRANSNPS